MTAALVVVLFNLRPGKTHGDYEAWARQADLPTVTGLDAVEGFEIRRVTGLMSKPDRAPYDYVELLDIRDLAAFRTEVSESDAMKRIAAEFRDWADAVFMVTEPLT